MLRFPFLSRNPGKKFPSPPATDDPVALLDFVYEDLSAFINPGISTLDVEARIQGLISETNAVPYFKGYRGYPSIVSTPVNSEVVHTPPSRRRILSEGDILTVEFGLELGGEHAFVGWTFPLGQISEERANLLRGAHGALVASLNQIRGGARVGLVSKTIHAELEAHGLFPCREFVGYRIGELPTMSPAIPCFGPDLVEMTPKIETGMKLAVMVIAHSREPELRVRDYWTVHDVRRADSAYFSALIRVTGTGFEQLNRHPVWAEPLIRGKRV